MKTDEKLIAILKDTIGRAEAKKAKPKLLIPTHQIALLAICALVLGPVTIYYNLDNQALKTEIAELKTSAEPIYLKDLPYYQRVMVEDFTVLPGVDAFCGDDFTQTIGGVPICAIGI